MMYEIVRGLSNESCERCGMFLPVAHLPNKLCVQCMDARSNGRLLRPSTVASAGMPVCDDVALPGVPLVDFLDQDLAFANKKSDMDDADYQDEFVGDLDFDIATRAGGCAGSTETAPGKALRGIVKDRKKALRIQKVTLDRTEMLDADGQPLRHSDGSVKMRVRISGQFNVHNVVEVDDNMLDVADDNGRDAVVKEFQQRMFLAGGYSLGKNHDGSYYKYANAMKSLFDYGPLVQGGPMFSKRSDFFQDWSKDLADNIILSIAKSKGGDSEKKVKHHVRCLRHGFDTFVKLVNEQSSA